MPYQSKRPQDVYRTQFLAEGAAEEDFKPFEDTPAEYLEAIRNRKVCRYAIKTTKAGKWLESELYPIWIATRDVPRGAKLEPSSAAQQILNDENSRKEFVRKINENFMAWVDKWTTFTCDNEHLVCTEAEGRKMVELFFERLRYLYKSRGHVLKYGYTVEYKNARDKNRRPICDIATGAPMLRLHIHAVINAGPSDKEIADKWRGGRIIQIRPLQPQKTGYAGLARYISKKAKEGRRRYACSLNLKKPRQSVAYYNRASTKTAVHNITKNENMRPEWFEKLYKGYEFVDCAAKFNEVNDGTYLYCRMELKDLPVARKKRVASASAKNGKMAKPRVS